MDSEISVMSVKMERRFLAPPLDVNGEDLLNKVCQEGGFAYVTLIMLAATGDIHAAEAAYDMAWEQLHSAPWHSVEPVWRDAYSLSCLHMASFHHRAGKDEEALRVLDMGLIMGGSLLRVDLNSAISFIQAERGKIADDSGAAKPALLATRNGSSAQGALRIHEVQIRPVSGRTQMDEDHFENRERPEMEACSPETGVLKNLPQQSFSSQIVEKQHQLSLENFLCNYLLKGVPVIITGAISHWPAIDKWRDMEYLKQVIGDRTVPVEVGQHYLASGWKQELIRVSELIERIQSSEQSSTEISYLAQHPLFDQISQLRDDILIPDYCHASGGEMQSVNAWFGPTGTVTPLHHDPHHNLLAQAVGRKYVRLYPASVSEALHPYAEPMLKNSSQVDLDNLDSTKYPEILNLSFMDSILEEGEMLYIPPKWWHYVRSLSTSLSVSFWWNAESRDDSK